MKDEDDYSYYDSLQPHESELDDILDAIALKSDVDDRLIDINDDNYKEIREFSQLGFTFYITYELARRNKQVEEILNLLYNIMLIYQKYIYLLLYKNFDIDQNGMDKITFTNYIGSIIIYLLKKFNQKEFINDFQNLELEEINEKISKLIEFFAEKLYNDYYIIYQLEQTDFPDEEFREIIYKDIYNPQKYLIRDKELIEHVNNIPDDVTNYRNNFEQKEHFSIYQGINKKTGKFSFYKIYQDSTSPMRNFTDANIVLNLNLPEDELISFIKEIKEEYNLQNCIKTRMQLLFKEIKITTTKYKDLTPNEWADCFFIYDYFRVISDINKKTTFQKIQEILTKQNGYKIEKTDEEKRISRNKGDNSKYKIVAAEEYEKIKKTNFDKKVKPFCSIKTIDDRLKFMNSLINDLNYRILLTK